MTQTPKSRSEAATVTGEPQAVEASPRYEDRYDRPNRFGQVLAWVGIIAGVLFIVALIFFSGLFLGWSSGGHYGRHHDGDRGYYRSQMGPGGQLGCPMMGPGGLMSPGGMMGPSQQPSPTTSAPTTPRP